MTNAPSTSNTPCRGRLAGFDSPFVIVSTVVSIPDRTPRATNELWAKQMVPILQSPKRRRMAFISINYLGPAVPEARAAVSGFTRCENQNNSSGFRKNKNRFPLGVFGTVFWIRMSASACIRVTFLLVVGLVAYCQAQDKYCEIRVGWSSERDFMGILYQQPKCIEDRWSTAVKYSDIWTTWRSSLRTNAANWTRAVHGNCRRPSSGTAGLPNRSSVCAKETKPNRARKMMNRQDENKSVNWNWS